MVAVGLLVARERWPGVRQVTWQITSVPAGAQVLDPDGQSLGQTPWQLKQRQDVGKTTLTIRLAGYREVRVYPDHGEDFRQTVELQSGRQPGLQPGL